SRQRRRLRYDLRRQALCSLPAAPSRGGVRRNRDRPCDRPTHHPSTRRPGLGRGSCRRGGSRVLHACLKLNWVIDPIHFLIAFSFLPAFVRTKWVPLPLPSLTNSIAALLRLERNTVSERATKMRSAGFAVSCTIN